jgi:hypothetical protein
MQYGPERKQGVAYAHSGMAPHAAPGPAFPLDHARARVYADATPAAPPDSRREAAPRATGAGAGAGGHVSFSTLAGGPAGGRHGTFAAGAGGRLARGRLARLAAR